MRIAFYQPAGEHERFAGHAFDNMIGQQAPFKIEGVERGQATVVAVEVDEDGKGATFTVDLPDSAGEALGRRSPLAGFTGDQPASFAFREPVDLIKAWENERRRS